MNKKAVIAALTGLLLGLVLWFALRSAGGEAKAHEVKAEKTRAASVAEQLEESNATTKRTVPRTGAPSFVREKPATPAVGLILDTTSPDYNAVKVVDVADVSVASVFEAEKRDPVWAPQRERELTEILEKDLATVQGKAQVKKVECRHATCQLLFYGKTLEEARWGHVLMQYAKIGGVLETGALYRADDGVYVGVSVAFYPRERDPDTWERAYQNARRAGLERARSRPIRPTYPPVPAE